MKIMLRYSCLFALLWSLMIVPSLAETGTEDRLQRIRRQLDTLTLRDPVYLSEVDISVGQMPLPELLRNVAKINGVSLSVKEAADIMVSCNFSRARVDELLYFLCINYNMDLDVVGNIVSIFPYIPLPAKIPDPVIRFNPDDTTLSYDFIQAPLIGITKQIAELTGINVVVPQPLYEMPVSGFVTAMPLDEALFTLAAVNGLEVANHKGSDSWSISAPANTAETPTSNTRYARRTQFVSSQLTVDTDGLVTAMIDNGNIYDIVLDVCEQLGLNYFFIHPVSYQTSVYLQEVPVNTLFSVLFTGTPYTYYREGGIYMFGESRGKELYATQLIPLKYRMVAEVTEIIPENLKENVQVQAFPDLNSIIASGDQREVARVEQFLQSIDHTVPLITIEIMILDVMKSRIDEAGIDMGIGDKPTATTGTLSPGIDLSLGGSTINKIINGFNGFGAINLGRVTPNFYMNLKFLEQNGFVELLSTPKLSTLNGHEAKLKSGETKYYKEVQNTYIGTQNPMQNTAYNWVSIEANMEITITPYVSENGEITLSIEIEQSEFTAREEAEAPPGLTTRSFQSLIRVQNEEVVLLGGIDRNTHEKSSGGLPFVARVPVLKWLFGNSTDNKREQQLNVFIKPTVIY